MTPPPGFDVKAYLDQTELNTSSLVSGEQWVEAAASGFHELHTSSPWWPRAWEDHIITVYRGCTDDRYGLKTSLHRCLDGGDRTKRITEKKLSDAENRMIDAARHGFYSAPETESWKTSGLGLNMSDGELLAVLQHQECPTRFLDVSRDALVALYFACEKDDHQDGRVFLVTLEHPENARPTRDWKEAKPWLDLSGAPVNGKPCPVPWPQATTPKHGDRDWRQRVCLVSPGNLDPRITAQQGLFLVGGLPTRQLYNASAAEQGVPEGQSTPQTLLRREHQEQVTDLGVYFTTGARRPWNQTFNAFARTVRIPGAMKPEIRKALASHGIGEGSIYPDFAGFRRLAHQVAATPPQASGGPTKRRPSPRGRRRGQTLEA